MLLTQLEAIKLLLSMTSNAAFMPLNGKFLLCGYCWGGAYIIDI
jgi:hypothetical protein